MSEWREDVYQGRLIESYTLCYRWCNCVNFSVGKAISFPYHLGLDPVIAFANIKHTGNTNTQWSHSQQTLLQLLIRLSTWTWSRIRPTLQCRYRPCRVRLCCEHSIVWSISLAR
jgi:hypothetical protein